jgi:LDH2 family malate/lactate/ureidoglycolate dehydrogenase
MNLNKRNYPPEHGIRLPVKAMEDLVIELFKPVGMPHQDAALLGKILAANDRRCLFSHGTKQIPYYLKKIKDGAVNPQPKISIQSEAPAALVLDGDGGLGYFPCYQGTQAIIKKAKAGGIAALTTRNHQHIGAASNYTRLALADDCIGLSTSSYATLPEPDSMVYDTVNTSPISIAVPAGQQPPLVMDMGGHLIPFEEEFFKRLPTPFFKTMALNSAVRALGGVFAGVFKPEIQSQSLWESGQGAFIVVVDVAHFMPLEELKRDMDRFIGAARQTKPLPGMAQAELAGGNEWHWDQENATQGIPVSDEHRHMLQQEADALSVDTPFAQYDNTRF